MGPRIDRGPDDWHRSARSCFRWAFVMYHRGDHGEAELEMDDAMFLMRAV